MIKTSVEENRIAKYRAERTQKAREATRATRTVIFKSERERCPELSGDMKSTIEEREIDRDTQQVSVGGKSGKSGRFVDYPGYVNDGTQKQAANPFHTEAAMDGYRDLKERLKAI